MKRPGRHDVPTGTEESLPVGGTLRRIGSFLLWWVLPSLIVMGVGAYFLAALELHASPPIVAVEGISMKPTLVTGDLVVLHGVKPSQLRVGDVIAVSLSPNLRKQYNLPSAVVHRIIKIQHTRAGLVFQTKGDNNSGPDVFRTLPGNITGEVKYSVPYAGLPILFFNSRQGRIFLIASAAILAMYFLLSAWDGRREELVATTYSVTNVLEEIEKVKELLTDPERLGVHHGPAPPEFAGKTIDTPFAAPVGPTQRDSWPNHPVLFSDPPAVIEMSAHADRPNEFQLVKDDVVSRLGNQLLLTARPRDPRIPVTFALGNHTVHELTAAHTIEADENEDEARTIEPLVTDNSSGAIETSLSEGQTNVFDSMTRARWDAYRAWRDANS